MAQPIRKTSNETPSILNLKISPTELIANISDGRTISIPISWFSRLAKAPLEKIARFEISPSGYGIHFPDLDEDISIQAFIDPEPSSRH